MLRAQHPARRRHELAAVSEHSRAPGAGIRGFLRAEPVSRYRLPFDLCGNLARIRAARWSSPSSRNSASSKTSRWATEELRRAKDYLKGSLVLGLESTSSRMSGLARKRDLLWPVLLARRAGGEHRSGDRGRRARPRANLLRLAPHRADRPGQPGRPARRARRPGLLRVAGRRNVEMTLAHSRLESLRHDCQ